MLQGDLATGVGKVHFFYEKQLAHVGAITILVKNNSKRHQKRVNTNFLGVASTVSSLTGTKCGIRSVLMDRMSLWAPYSSYKLKPSSLYRRSDTFHNFIVLSETMILLHMWVNVL